MYRGSISSRGSIDGTPPLSRLSIDSDVGFLPSGIPTHRGSMSRVSVSSNSVSNPPVALAPPANRVKVAVRCRPPFEEEGLESIISIPPAVQGVPPKTLQIEVGPEKVREFTFDAVFGPEAQNPQVYDVVAGPVVDGVMNGINGTVLAYGQTGSGKTYSLGILSRVTGESGIIPRSLSHVFGYINNAQQNGSETKYSVTISFLQLYLDCVMDLLSPSLSGNNGGNANNRTSLVDNSFSSVGGLNTSLNSINYTPGGSNSARPARAHSLSRNENAFSTSSSSTGATSSSVLQSLFPGFNNLAVREDPVRGFYVEGLSEFSVDTFEQALGLLNTGLSNRVVGATKMNYTSSRSHTMLIVRVESRRPAHVALGQPGSTGGPLPSSQPSGTNLGWVSQRSQLVLLDLAGSESVRRTSSKGMRLEEARAINASLHTLGQVISALAAISIQNQSQSQIGNSNSSANANQSPFSAPRIHVPWRDSKLTRLLQGSLGGSANTYLLAAIGPSARNVNETLSTLAFASRCMRVAAVPVAPSALADAPGGSGALAELAARLQQRLGESEQQHRAEMKQVQERFEGIIKGLRDALERSESNSLKLSETPSNNAFIRGENHGLISAEHLASGEPISEELYLRACRAYDAAASAVLAAAARAASLKKKWDTLSKEDQVAKKPSNVSKPAPSDVTTPDEYELEFNNGISAMEGIQPSQVGAVPFVELEDALGRDTALRLMEKLKHSSKKPTPGALALSLDMQHPSSDSAPRFFRSQNSANSENSENPLETDLLSYISSSSFAVPYSTPPSSKSSSLALEDSQLIFHHPPYASLVLPLPDPAAASARASENPFNITLHEYVFHLLQATAENGGKAAALLRLKDWRFEELKSHLLDVQGRARASEEDVNSQRFVIKYLLGTVANLRTEIGLLGEETHQKHSSTPSSEISKNNNFPDGSSKSKSYLSLDSGFISSPASEVPTELTSPYSDSSASVPAVQPIPPAAKVVSVPEMARPPRPPKPTQQPLVQSLPQPQPPVISASSGISIDVTPAQNPRATPISADRPSSSPQAAVSVDEPVDEIEAIIAHRVVMSASGEPTLLYKVRWKDSSPDDDEWFHRDDLLHDFPVAVSEYESSVR